MKHKNEEEGEDECGIGLIWRNDRAVRPYLQGNALPGQGFSTPNVEARWRTERMDGDASIVVHGLSVDA